MTIQAGEQTGVATFAVIKVGPAGGTPLADEARRRVIRAVAETNLHLPGMFEIAFINDTGDVTGTADLSIGTEVRIFGPASADGTSPSLIAGEVTSIEGIFEHRTFITVVRGYDQSHRLQRTRRTRTFLNMKDSDIARQLATDAGLTPGQIDASATTHAHLGQCDQTDWEFLTQRAREIGFETGVRDGKFYFRKASTIAAGGEPVPLTFRKELYSFRPRLTAGNLAPAVEVRIWDPAQGKVVSSQVSTAAGSARLTGQEPAALARKFGAAPGLGAAGGAAGGAGEDLGPAPAANAYVVLDRPAATGASIAAAADEIAAGLADHIGSTFAEAEGEATGTPAIQAGAAIQVAGVPAPFAGTWLVTCSRHVFDLSEGGYRTWFEVSGRQERSLLGLASAAAARPAAPRVPGLACGVVTGVFSPGGEAGDPAGGTVPGRVKVRLPWLSPDYESDWAPVLQFGAGKVSGAMFLPQVGDEVLVGFELGDPRRPYVLGGIVNAATGYNLGATVQDGQVIRRGFVSSSGNHLIFHDEMPPPGTEGPPQASDITLGTSDGTLGLAVDQTNGTVTVNCQPAPPASNTAAGQLTIKCGNAGVVNIMTGPGGSVTIDGGDTLSLKAQASITIQSSGQVAIKGSQIMLN